MIKFPHFIQYDATDCGPTCLKILTIYYGRNISLTKIRDITFKTRTGVSFLSLSDAAEKLGFRTHALKLNITKLQDINLPCIIHWNQNHFVVLYKIKKNTVYISDPAIGLIKYSISDFLKFWATSHSEGELVGFALTIQPTPDYYLSEDIQDEKKINFRFLFKYLKPYTKLIIQLLFGFIIGSLLSLIFPFLTQAIVDIGITTNNLNFIVLILVSQLVLTISQTCVGFIRSWIMLHVSTRISIALISDFLIKLMKLPISFFDTKMIGDIRQRIDDNGRIQAFLTGSLISMSFGIFSFIVYSIILAIYNWTILLIFYLGSALYVTWILLFLKRRKELDYKRFAASASNQSNIYQLITGMQEIKLNCCEKRKRWEWEDIQAKLFTISIKGLSLNQNQQAGSIFLNQIQNIFISFLSAKAVIEGNLTLGMMMAVQYIIGQLNGPIQEFIGFIQTAQDAKISLDRLDEIYSKEDEYKEEFESNHEFQKLKSISLKNVAFHYEGPRSPIILDHVSLNIPENKITAIVGTSGSGKTTLIKLLLGFYEPFEGEIKIGNVDLKKISIEKWRTNCGTVMQDGFIFSDSIAKNIAISDEMPDREKLYYAADLANIREYIESLPMGYNTKIGQEGSGLSQGQKQRLLIARAIYKDPKFLFFDEATNSLDANNETIIMNNLNSFFHGRTVVIVAHRLSTVKSADQIVVLEKGKIVEIGTHHDLVDSKGNYYQLIKNQLELGN